MNEITLPPSPNWYLSNILACSKDGTVAWGTRNAIVIAKPENDSKILRYSVLKNAHRERVTSLSFAHQLDDQNDILLASTGDDNAVKIWNMNTLSLVYIYSLEGNKQAVEVDWSYIEPLMVYFVSLDSHVTSWNIRFNITSTIYLGKETATCLSCCPHDSNLLAVGSKSGLVYIVSFQGKGTVLYKLRGHDTEVVSLSWCPSSINVISNNGKRDLLLASGGRDRSIYIWRAGGDGRYETEIMLPTSPLDSQQHRSKLNVSAGNWVTVCWIEPKLLFASSTWGELISWDLSMRTKNKPVCKLIHACHIRGLFCIANVPSVQKDVDDWRATNSITVWTLAQDRQIVCCCIHANNVEIQYTIPTQGGYVYCMAACPLDTSRVAFGVGDAMLRLWNLSEAHDVSFDITSLWQKIKGKVRAVSWHPEKENLLAYATDEGRIGIFDTNSNKPPMLYRQYHRSTVYVIGWGPSLHSNNYILYSCGEGELVSYESEKSNREPMSIVKQECTEFSWKPDFSCLAVGFENGSISFFSRDLIVRGHTIHGSRKRVHCLAWHPESTATDLSLSPLRNYLAVAFDHSTIIVFNLSNLMDHITRSPNVNEIETEIEKSNSKENDLYKVHEVIATLSGHIDKVVCLAWSTHFSGHLVSGSYDNTAQVWNVETQELMATYTGHCAPVLCCMWSPLHPDFIMTGSADFTIRIWKIENHTAIMPEQTENTAKKPSSKKHKTKVQSKSCKTNGSLLQNSSKPQVDTILTTPSVSIVEAKKISTSKETKKKKSDRASYFSKGTKVMNDKTVLLNSMIEIVKNAQNQDTKLNNQQDDFYNTALPLFSKKEDFMSFLTDEKSLHVAEEKYNLVTEMDVWCDNLKENLEAATKERRLNDFLVSLAPSLSTKIWKDVCEAYANQLIADGNPQKAVSYLLCIHKPYRAIQILENSHLYKEAYAVARCKLDSEDPVLKNVLKNWAKYNVETGQFEHAAYIYATLREFSEAIKYLSRRKDVVALTTAAEIALLSGDRTLSTSLAEQAIDTALINSDCNMAREVITKFSNLEYRQVHLRSFEELKKTIEGKMELQTIATWLDGKSNSGLLQTLKSSYGDCHSYYPELRQNTFNDACGSEEMLWLKVSHEIAMAVTCEMKEQALKHIVAALGLVSHFAVLHRNVNKRNFLINALIKLDDRSPSDEESIYAKSSYAVSSSLRGYLCFGLVHWLVDVIKTEGVHEQISAFIELLETLLTDVLNKRAIRHWTLTNEINKLETRLASILAGKSQAEEASEAKNEETERENENGKKDTTTLVEELNTFREQKKQFIEEQVSTPNPVIVYSTANELASILTDESVKSSFLKVISDAWKDATT